MPSFSSRRLYKHKVEHRWKQRYLSGLGQGSPCRAANMRTHRNQAHSRVGGKRHSRRAEGDWSCADRCWAGRLHTDHICLRNRGWWQGPWGRCGILADRNCSQSWWRWIRFSCWGRRSSTKSAWEGLLYLPISGNVASAFSCFLVDVCTTPHK